MLQEKHPKYIIDLFSAYNDGHLLIFSSTHIDVFDSQAGEWVQTLNLRGARPLNNTGSLCLCILDDIPHLIYISSLRGGKSSPGDLKNAKQHSYVLIITADELKIHAVGTLRDVEGSGTRGRARRRFSVRDQTTNSNAHHRL